MDRADVDFDIAVYLLANSKSTFDGVDLVERGHYCCCYYQACSSHFDVVVDDIDVVDAREQTHYYCYCLFCARHFYLIETRRKTL